MNNYPSIVRNILWRALLAVPFFVIGWRMLPTAGNMGAVVNILGGIFFFLVGAVIVAFPLARLSAEPWGSLFYPSRMTDKKAPMYGIPQAKRKKGLYEESVKAYEVITQEYPGALQAYVELIDLLVMDLRDLERAERVYQEGMMVIQDEEDRRALGTMYRAITSRYFDQIPVAHPKIQLKRGI